MKYDHPVIYNCIDAQEWDAFVDCIPWATPQHAFAWGHALENCFGYLQQTYKLLKINDNIVAALPLIRLSGGWPFRSLHSLVFDSYGGPLIHPDYLGKESLLRFISTVIDSEVVQYGAFEAKLVTPPLTPKAVVQCLLKNDTSIYLKRDCLLLSLDRSLDSIVAGYSSSVQRAIKRSVQEGIFVKVESRLTEIHAAYPIYRNTMHRLGGIAKPWRFIEVLLRDKLAVTFLARRNESLVGIIVLLVSRHMALYWISATDPAASLWRPTNALVDHAIKWCHSRGIKLFSFGESPENRPGLVRFKEGWGTERGQSTTVLRVYHPHIQRMWTALEPIARRCYAVWDKYKYGDS